MRIKINCGIDTIQILFQEVLKFKIIKIDYKEKKNKALTRIRKKLIYNRSVIRFQAEKGSSNGRYHAIFKRYPKGSELNFHFDIFKRYPKLLLNFNIPHETDYSKRPMAFFKELIAPMFNERKIKYTIIKHKV